MERRELFFMRALFSFVLFFILLGCVSPAPPSNNPPANQPPLQGADALNGQPIQFQSEDGITLVGTYWKNTPSSKPPVLLMHQLSRDRHSFDTFAQYLFQHGYSVLSFDLRGHGDSTKKGSKQISFVDFTDADYQFLPSDIWSAKKFLNVEKIMVVGASIGANASLLYASQDSSSLGVVLLSPGDNYRGLDISSASKEKRVPFLAVASREDTYSASSSQNIFETGPLIDKKLLILENAGHGTDMLLAAPELSKTILDWLNAHSS